MFLFYIFVLTNDIRSSWIWAFLSVKQKIIESPNLSIKSFSYPEYSTSSARQLFWAKVPPLCLCCQAQDKMFMDDCSSLRPASTFYWPKVLLLRTSELMKSTRVTWRKVEESWKLSFITAGQHQIILNVKASVYFFQSFQHLNIYSLTPSLSVAL